jgi:hypothetical protein
VRSTEIREDCTYVSEIFDAVRSKPLDAVVGEWRRMIKKYRRRAIIAEGTNPKTGEKEQVTMPAQLRWSEGREAEVYNRLMSLERGVEERYGDNYSTVMLTFTASNRSASEMAEYRCMGDHLDDVLSSWGVVRRELARQLEGREWHYARVLEPQKSGYAHAHVAVFVKGRVSEERFRPVIEKHTEYVGCAGGSAHTLEKAVSRTDGDEMRHPGQYLAEYIMQNYGDDVLEAEPHIQRFNAVMWATGKRRFSVSEGVKELVELGRREGDEPDGWLVDCELVGLEIEDAETGEKTLHTDWDGGSVQKTKVDPSPGKDPPVQRPAAIPVD